MTNKLCPVCFNTIEDHCPDCNIKFKSDISNKHPEKIENWKITGIIDTVSDEKVYKVKNEDKQGLLVLFSNKGVVKLDDHKSCKGEIDPLDHGEFHEFPFMVWPWPERVLGGSKKIKNPLKLWNTLILPLENRNKYFKREPRPWEIVKVDGKWGILTGWDRIYDNNSYLPPVANSFASPERFSGGIWDEKSMVWCSGSILYFIMTSQLPQGLPVTPSGNSDNLSPFDISIFKSLSYKSDNRPDLDEFYRNISKSKSINYSKLFVSGLGAFAGLILLVGLGFGFAIALSSIW